MSPNSQSNSEKKQRWRHQFDSKLYYKAVVINTI